jgi:putative ABC transport system permease protein
MPRRFVPWFGRARRERELDAELRFDIERRVEALVSGGMSEAEARRKARLDFGGLEQAKEACREVRTVTLIENAFRDLRYGARALRRSPGFATVAVLSLALGIGVNTAIFSAVDAAVLRALPYRNPDRVVMLWEDGSRSGSGKNWPSPGNFCEWQRRNQVFEGVAALVSVSATLTSDGPPEQVFGRLVTANFFPVVGVRPMLGRTFTEEEESQRAPVAVISYGLWQRRYAGDPQFPGRRILLDGRNVTVLGVLPRDFALQRRDVAFWMPASFSAADLQNRRAHALHVVARLKPDATLERARADMRAIAAEMAALYPEDRRVGAAVVPIKEELLGKARTGLLMLMAAAGCVLLIACANLASLLLARTLARRREISVRVALGAGQGRVVRQIVIEGLILAAAGGLVGILAASPGIHILEKLVPETLPPSAVPQVDGRLVAFAVLLSLLTGLLFSVIPALRIARRPPIDALKQDGRTGAGLRGSRMRDVLVVSEVALALVLLAGAGLLLRTLANMSALPLGFRSDHLLTLRTVLPPKYRDVTARLAFADRVMDGVRTLPGVSGAAYVSTLPFESRGDTAGYQVEGRQLDPDDPGEAVYRVATDDYLQVLGSRLKEGRWFARGDGPAAAPVVVVNESFARKYWPGERAVGHRIGIGGNDPKIWRTVVGVVWDIRETGYEAGMKPAIYQPAAQAIRQTRDLIVRTAGEPSSMAPAVRRVIAAVDPEQPVIWVRSMEEMIDLNVADRRQFLMLLATFAGLALVLACIGLYGILSSAVARRRRELGIRMALGATGASVQRMMVGRGLVLTAAGVGIGLAAALALTRWMGNLLYRVDAADPCTFASVSALLGAVAAVACWIPAHQASRLDPVAVLREE